MTEQTNLEDKIRALLNGEGSADDKIQAIYDLLPSQLFLAKATHPDCGEGIVISHYPDRDGDVRFAFQSDRANDGTGTFWVSTSTLTFHDPGPLRVP